MFVLSVNSKDICIYSIHSQHVKFDTWQWLESIFCEGQNFRCCKLSVCVNLYENKWERINKSQTLFSYDVGLNKMLGEMWHWFSSLFSPLHNSHWDIQSRELNERGLSYFSVKSHLTFWWWSHWWQSKQFRRANIWFCNLKPIFDTLERHVQTPIFLL